MKNKVLKKYFGHDSFRVGQEEIIDNILRGRDVLAVMPTGAGKSICYQIPAIMSEGVALVVSPLISLMKDQVTALVQAGVRAAFLNSTLSPKQYELAVSRAIKGEYKIIYIAPERLLTDEFITVARCLDISMITVDEAHCVSQWGQDFRPSYLNVPQFVEKLDKRPVICAFTATATESVKKDISELLLLDKPFEITTGFNVKNLYYEVREPLNKLNELIRILKTKSGKSGIVYCLARKTVEEVCDEINDAGISATRYHAGLDQEERNQNQEDFIYDRKTVMVATNAFGMGIDKSNVSFVIHYNMPKDLESYYQEAGRAGRDGEAADCILLYGKGDVRKNLFLIENGNENVQLSPEMKNELIKRDKARLKVMNSYCKTTECLREYILKYFGEQTVNYCGNCGNCISNFEDVEITTQAQMIISCVIRLKKKNRKVGRLMLCDILHGSKRENLVRQGYNNFSTYAIMRDTPLKEIKWIVEFLIDNGYLFSSEEHYYTIFCTRKGAEFIKNTHKIIMKMPKEINTNIVKREVEIDEGLRDTLKKVRQRLAKKQGVPPYVIFNDASIRDMCKKLPTNQEEFLMVSGVGEYKAKKYGRCFIEAIMEYIN